MSSLVSFYAVCNFKSESLFFWLLNFLNLRADKHAQYEIRAYANAMLKTVKKWVPIAYEAFVDYRVGGLELS